MNGDRISDFLIEDGDKHSQEVKYIFESLGDLLNVKGVRFILNHGIEEVN